MYLSWFSFVLTVLAEFFVYFVFLPKKYSFWYVLLFILIINLLTQPLVFSYLPQFFHSRAAYLLFAELSVPVIEGVILIFVFKKEYFLKIIALSFLANLLSFVLGLIIFNL